MSPAVRVAARTADSLGESPWWDVGGNRLYWVDVRAPALHRLDPATGRTGRWPMPGLVGAVVGRAAGGVVVALPDGLHGFDPATERLRPIAPLDLGGADMRLNDAKVDAAGRLWFGSMRDYGADAGGGLWCLAPGRPPQRMRAGVRVPNAIAISPDGRMLAFADTRDGRIERAVIGADGADRLDWRVLAAADIAPGRPDGATFDAEGFLWNARYGGGCLARIAPDGRLDRLVELPVSQPTSCAFGGENLATLFVTSARQGLAPDAEPLAGSVLAFEPGVCGLPEPAFPG